MTCTSSYLDQDCTINLAELVDMTLHFTSQTDDVLYEGELGEWHGVSVIEDPYPVVNPVTGDVVKMADGTKYLVTSKGWRKL